MRQVPVVCRGALPSLRAPSLTSLYIKASGLGPPAGGGPSGVNLPSFLSFDRSVMCACGFMLHYLVTWSNVLGVTLSYALDMDAHLVCTISGFSVQHTQDC